MKKITVAVTGLNATDSPGPGVPVLRSLKESSLNLELLGFSYDVLEPGNFMNLIENSFLIPYPNSGPAQLIERIRYINSIQKLDVIFPTLDSELDNYIEIQPDLDKLEIKTFLPSRKELHTRDKTVLVERLKEANINLPKTITVQDVSAVKQASDSLGFPLLVKGIFYEAYLAYSLEEAIGFFYRLASKWGIPIILQEFIKGEEYNVVSLALSGETLGAVVMKKLFLTDKGKAWAGVTIDHNVARETSKKILEFIHWNGGCELEYILESSTDKLYLLEINPRFPAWVYLATASGMNLPDAQIRLMLGLPIQINEKYEIGKIFVRHSWDEIIPMKQIENLSVSGQLKK
ncbi:MAG: ATP-grasp domain-containing protein [Leptospiraceae bacterium]|nr:ATP-grasp domain-containing protein [Leptospiraceae bacterium]